MKATRKKALRYTLLAAAAIVVLLVSLLLFKPAGRVSEPARAIITTMLTAPNSDLTSSSPARSPSDAPLTTQEEQERQAAALQNWEDAVGGYFCEGGLAEFLMTQGLLLQSSAMECGVAASVSRLELVEKAERYEDVLATVLIDGEPREAHVTVRYNPDGSVYRVVVAELNELSRLYRGE